MPKLSRCLLAISILVQACAAPPPEKPRKHPGALDRSPVWTNPDGSASGKKSLAEELELEAEAPQEDEVRADEPDSPGMTQGLVKLKPMGFEQTPLPGGGLNPGWSSPGGDHTGAPGDAFGGGFRNDPQYAGFFNPHAPSGATAPHHPRPHEPSGSVHYLDGPTETQITESKKAWKTIEQRGEDVLEKYRDFYEDEHEATSRACIFSCSGSYTALCGDVERVCSVGNSIVPLFPGRFTPCKSATAAACEGHPDDCIMRCFSDNGSRNGNANRYHGDDPAYYTSIPARRPSSGEGNRAPPRAFATWKEVCVVGCAVLAGGGCAAVSGSCVTGALWSFGGILIPCAYAVTAACMSAAGITATCALRCGGG